jgi:hypothetical protein
MFEGIGNSRSGQLGLILKMTGDALPIKKGNMQIPFDQTEIHGFGVAGYAAFVGLNT